jgi:hypothetical protein
VILIKNTSLTPKNIKEEQVLLRRMNPPAVGKSCFLHFVCDCGLCVEIRIPNARKKNCVDVRIFLYIAIENNLKTVLTKIINVEF